MPFARPTTSRSLALALLVGTALTAPSAFADQTILVTNGNDAGPGSLRAALAEAAATDMASQVALVTADDIRLESGLSYTGQAPLELFGNGQTVRLGANATLLTVAQGADLTVRGIDFRGPGGFSIENRGDVNATAGKGIFVDVRDDQTGLVTLVLDRVTVQGVAGHGVHVSDCDLADDCGGGGGGAGGGSAASIVVEASHLTIKDVGNGRFDADGLRVDERGEGSVHFTATSSSFTLVGADGVELDEGGPGDVRSTVTGSLFAENGAYCDPRLLKALLPTPDEAEFADGEKKEADIPGAVTGSADDRCIEREVDLYASGSVEKYEFGIDLDDGIDIDEAGEGSLISLMTDTMVRDNLDEGIDFDEEDGGDIRATFVRTTASFNTDDGFKMTEEDDGDMIGQVFGAKADANGGKGLVFEEENNGNLAVALENTNTANNDDGDKTGLELVQTGEGTGKAEIKASHFADGIDADGVTVDELGGS